VRTRLISAAVLVPVVVIVFWIGNPYLIFGIAGLAAVAGYEVAQLVRRAGLPANVVIAVVAPPLLILGVATVAPAIALVVIVTGALALVFTDPQTGFKAWAGNLIAILYPSLIGFASAISRFGYRTVPYDTLEEQFGSGLLWLVILVLSVWTLDSAAYVVGRYFPRGHFFNHVSPKKTWSGAIGGTFAAVVVCALLATTLLQVDAVLGALIGFLIAVSAQAGDLVESMLKRAAGAKDSGTLIPGHGGVLDRIDSFLFAAPVLYVLLVFFGLNHQFMLL
jgi:phosphatidate cytidylyltransferase